MLNVYHSRLDESEIGRALDNTVSALVSEEDSGWFADWMDLWKDISLSSSDSDDDKIFRPRKRERERVKVRLNFLILQKGEWHCEEK